MVVCKFFLSGNCRFGTNCRFEHIYNKQFSYRGPDNQNQNFSNQQPSYNDEYSASHYKSTQYTKVNEPSKPTNDTIINSVIKDATTVLESKQWLLTCFAPFKEKPCFSGFEDTSIEEVRYSMYLAQKNGNPEIADENVVRALILYKNQGTRSKIQQFNQLYSEYFQKFSALKNPSEDLKQAILILYNSQIQNQQQSVFGQQSTFHQQQPTLSEKQSIFGNTAQQQNVTQQNNLPIFVKPFTQTNVFGGSTNENLQGNLYSKKPSFSFVNQQMSPTQQSSFLNGSNVSYNWHQQPNVQNENTFNQQSSNVGFNNFDPSISGIVPINQTNNFHNNQSFGGQANNSTFGQINKSTFGEQINNSTFGGQVNNSTFGRQPNKEMNNELYSIVASLPQEDIEAFKNDQFLCGLIPEVAPPKELCF